MAERLNKRHQDLVRQKIKVSQIINRLHKHVDGDIDMNVSQLQVAKLLLDKVICDSTK